jgi:hypothetical protein
LEKQLLPSGNKKSPKGDILLPLLTWAELALWAILLWTCDVHRKAATTELLVMPLVDSCVSHLLSLHLDETETA